MRIRGRYWKIAVIHQLAEEEKLTKFSFCVGQKYFIVLHYIFSEYVVKKWEFCYSSPTFLNLSIRLISSNRSSFLLIITSQNDQNLQVAIGQRQSWIYGKGSTGKALQETSFGKLTDQHQFLDGDTYFLDGDTDSWMVIHISVLLGHWTIIILILRCFTTKETIIMDHM